MANNINNHLEFSNELENENYIIKWRGFVFIPGFRNGNDSIEQLAHMCSDTSIMSHIHKLKGKQYRYWPDRAR